MPGAAKETHNEVKESLTGEDDTRKSQKKPKLNHKSHANKVDVKLSKKKVDCLNQSKTNQFSKRDVTISSFSEKTKSLKKSSLSSQNDNLHMLSINDGEEDQSVDVKTQKLKDKKRRKKRKGHMELDEASRLQRRTRYLLIKLKLEQNLIDAYSTEGWKGQSREKIKPQNELLRAREQILKCKLGIREVIRQLDLLSSVGRIDDSAVAPDGSVHHEHIICAKCKLREAFPDNDIILCDGTCNRAFHQKCLDPPLLTENIPPGDEGWFCKFCKSKMEILEATNAHLGTDFALDSNWQDIFKEEADIPVAGDSLECAQSDWPSDDSDDDDFDPDKIVNTCSASMTTSESVDSDNFSSFSSWASLEDEVLFLTGRSDKAAEFFIGVDSDETTDCEAVCGRRQRPTVDYIKLNDELFGRNARAEEQISEDEDWGPTKRKRRGKESDAANTIITEYENENEKFCNEEETAEEKMHEPTGKTRRPFFRIPPHAVEQLRIAFAENELPSRAVREHLAKDLGLEFEKVNKWFKNSRYLALKARKEEREKLGEPSLKSLGEAISETAENGQPILLASKSPESTPMKFKRFDEKVSTSSLTNPSGGKQHERDVASPAYKRPADFDDDVSLKFLLAQKEKLKRKTRSRVPGAEADMERLCRLKDKIEKLQQVLAGLPNGRSNKAGVPTLNESLVIYVPAAELKVKR